MKVVHGGWIGRGIGLVWLGLEVGLSYPFLGNEVQGSVSRAEVSTLMQMVIGGLATLLTVAKEWRTGKPLNGGNGGLANLKCSERERKPVLK